MLQYFPHMVTSMRTATCTHIPLQYMFQNSTDLTLTCSLNESTSVAHSLMPRKLETSSASHVAGSRLPPLRERGVVPLESTRRGITLGGAAGAEAGGADVEAALSSDA